MTFVLRSVPLNFAGIMEQGNKSLAIGVAHMFTNKHIASKDQRTLFVQRSAKKIGNKENQSYQKRHQSKKGEKNAMKE